MREDILTVSKGNHRLNASITENRSNITLSIIGGEMENAACAYIETTDLEYLKHFNSANAKNIVEKVKEYDMFYEYKQCIIELVKVIYSEDISFRNTFCAEPGKGCTSDDFIGLKLGETTLADGYKNLDPEEAEITRQKKLMSANKILEQRTIGADVRLIAWANKIELQNKDKTVVTIPYEIRSSAERFVGATLKKSKYDGLSVMLYYVTEDDIQFMLDAACKYLFKKEFTSPNIIKGFLHNNHTLDFRDFKQVAEQTCKLSEEDINKIADIVFERVKKEILANNKNSSMNVF